MKEFFYVNSKNEKLNFTSFPYIAADISELLNYGHSYDSESNKITSIYDTVKESAFSIHVHGNNEVEYKNAINKFYEVIEYDVLNKKTGKLYLDGQYLPCNLISSKKEKWYKWSRYHLLQIGIISDKPFWINELEYNFNISEMTSSNNKEYAYKYAYRYANGLNNTYVINPHFTDSNFKLIIYGPATNPMVVIGENSYLVYIVLEAGERLEIDSKAGTVHKIQNNGVLVNAFHNRQKKRTFFKKIAPGRQSVSWTGNFSFDLIVYEERSEPKWN